MAIGLSKADRLSGNKFLPLNPTLKVINIPILEFN